MKRKEIIKQLVKDNDYNYNILKAIEELQELSLVLTQHLTKGVKRREIIDEIGDVKIRIEILEKIFGEEDVDKRVNDKLTKFDNYIKEGKYIGRI